MVLLKLTLNLILSTLIWCKYCTVVLEETFYSFSYQTTQQRCAFIGIIYITDTVNSYWGGVLSLFIYMVHSLMLCFIRYCTSFYTRWKANESLCFNGISISRIKIMLNSFTYLSVWTFSVFQIIPKQLEENRLTSQALVSDFFAC